MCNLIIALYEAFWSHDPSTKPHKYLIHCGAMTKNAIIMPQQPSHQKESVSHGPPHTPEQFPFTLSDGRTIQYLIRPSAKARRVKLTISPSGGLVVVAPLGISYPHIFSLIGTQEKWIAKHLTTVLPEALEETHATYPQTFDLPALGQTWHITYRPTDNHSVSLRVEHHGRLTISGAIANIPACHAVLQRWLIHHANQTLAPWFSSLAQKKGLRYSHLGIRNQRARWGSCSATRRIHLNAKLLFLSSELVSYVMMHELCHLLELNHSKKFWAQLRTFEPASDDLHQHMRRAWKFVPSWAIG